MKLQRWNFIIPCSVLRQRLTAEAQPRRSPRVTGFTLIELMVAFMALSLSMTGLLALQLTSLQANHRARELAEATQLCQDKIEQLRAGPMPLPSPPLGGEVLDSRGCLVTGDVRPSCSPPLPGPRYTRTWVIDPGMINRFEVRTSWVAIDGSNHSVSVSHVR